MQGARASSYGCVREVGKVTIMDESARAKALRERKKYVEVS